MTSKFFLVSPTDHRFFSYFGELLVGKKNGDPDCLLFKSTDPVKPEGRGIYECDLRQKAFIYHEAEDVWNSSTTGIEVFVRDSQMMRKNENLGRGKHTLFKSESPQNDKLAILTTSGFILKTPSIFPSEGESEHVFCGRRYLEIIDLNAPRTRSKALKIRGLTLEPHLFWTRDGRFVVVTDGLFSLLGVVDVAEIEFESN
jgi:hypothetical protein